MTEDPRDRPDLRVYVDEDWKARVQAEKEELERRRREKPPEAASHPQSEGPVPPATLEVLVSTLGMQAMMAIIHPCPVRGVEPGASVALGGQALVTCTPTG